MFSWVLDNLLLVLSIVIFLAFVGLWRLKGIGAPRHDVPAEETDEDEQEHFTTTVVLNDDATDELRAAVETNSGGQGGGAKSAMKGLDVSQLDFDLGDGESTLEGRSDRVIPEGLPEDLDVTNLDIDLGDPAGVPRELDFDLTDSSSLTRDRNDS